MWFTETVFVHLWCEGWFLEVDHPPPTTSTPSPLTSPPPPIPTPAKRSSCKGPVQPRTPSHRCPPPTVAPRIYFAQNSVCLFEYIVFGSCLWLDSESGATLPEDQQTLLLLKRRQYEYKVAAHQANKQGDKPAALKYVRVIKVNIFIEYSDGKTLAIWSFFRACTCMLPVTVVQRILLSGWLD